MWNVKERYKRTKGQKIANSSLFFQLLKRNHRREKMEWWKRGLRAKLTHHIIKSMTILKLHTVSSQYPYCMVCVTHVVYVAWRIKNKHTSQLRFSHYFSISRETKSKGLGISLSCRARMAKITYRRLSIVDIQCHSTSICQLLLLPYIQSRTRSDLLLSWIFFVVQRLH